MINCVNCNAEIQYVEEAIQVEKMVYCSNCYDKLVCLNCNGIKQHSDQCSSCFEFVRHQNLKQGLCRYCRMKTEDPDSYAEHKHMGLLIDNSSSNYSETLEFDGFDEF